MPAAILPHEADLVATATRDRQAFAVLYERHLPAVYGYCVHQLGSRDAAEDATSLIFAKALAGLPSMRGTSFRGWLFGIAHHVVADVRRARPADVPLDVAWEVSDPGPSPEGVALAADSHRALAAAVARLSPTQRHVVELRLAGLTSAEIGQALGCSRRAVDVAQYRAVQRLRRLMAAATDAEEVRDGR
jgi:RNA polymerase sigma-70 factor (ECF subfamily)